MSGMFYQLNGVNDQRNDSLFLRPVTRSLSRQTKEFIADNISSGLRSRGRQPSQHGAGR